MSRKFVVAAAALAAFVLTAPAASAGQHKKIDPTIDATNFWVGAAWTGAAVAMAKPVAPVIVGTTIGCMATAPMVATVALNRPLKYREAHILIGSCVVPIIGGWLVNEAYNSGWLWAPDEKPVRVAHHDKKKMAARPAVKDVMEPKGSGADLTFRLCEGLFIAKKA